MTRRIDDLLTVWRSEEDDVCSTDQLLDRVAHTAPIIRRRKVILAVAAAVIVIVGVVATFVALLPRPTGPHAGPVTVIASTPRVTPTAPIASPTAKIDRRTHIVDLGNAHIRVPTRWYAAPYLGEVPTVYFPTIFFSTHRFAGPCSLKTRQPASCTTQYYFPPRSTTPRDGLIILWSRAEFPGSFDHLALFPGKTTTVDHRPAKVYTGKARAGCPSGASTEIHADVVISSKPFERGNYYDMVACLGPNVSEVDRQAVYAMIASLRITS